MPRSLQDLVQGPWICLGWKIQKRNGEKQRHSGFPFQKLLLPPGHSLLVIAAWEDNLVSGLHHLVLFILSIPYLDSWQGRSWPLSTMSCSSRVQIWVCSMTVQGLDNAGHTKQVWFPYPSKGLYKPLMVSGVPDHEKPSVTSTHMSKPSA